MTPAPIHNQTIIELTNTPSVTDPVALGDDTSVRYRSSASVVRTAGVPIAEVAPGKITSDGCITATGSPPRATTTSETTLVFCGDSIADVSTYVRS